MKIEDLHLFVEVAKEASLRNAAVRLSMQPGTLSKAIKRIEDYYQHELFDRTGHGWQLTPAGKLLRERAVELLGIHEKIEFELGNPRRCHVRVSGPAGVLAHYLPTVVNRLSTHQTDHSLDIKIAPDLSPLLKHQVDIALTTTLAGQSVALPSIYSEKICDVPFVIVASKHHPLAIHVATHSQPIDIQTVLTHPFIVPSHPAYGHTVENSSEDGWFDSEFKRKITARVDDISTLIALVNTQPWLAYMPQYLAEHEQLPIITTRGCPYACVQSIWLCRQKNVQYHWIHQLFQEED